MFKKIVFLIVCSVWSVSILADCNFKNQIPINAISTGKPAWQAMAKNMAECGNFLFEDASDITNEKLISILTTSPEKYHLTEANSYNLASLAKSKTIRNLDDLVNKYGQQLSPNQIIKYEGQVLAIAIAANTSYFAYRKDWFKKLKLPEPNSYERVIKSAEKIKSSGLAKYPLGGFYNKTSLGKEFVYIYEAIGGKFVGKKKRATLNNKKGVRTLKLMKQLSTYMPPNFLQSDWEVEKNDLMSGKVGMTSALNSHLTELVGADSALAKNIKLSLAPKSKRGGLPSASLSWQGFAIMSNTSNAEAEAAFKLAMAGLSSAPKTAKSVLWLAKDSETNDFVSNDLVSKFELNAPELQSLESISLMHKVINKHLLDFFNNKTSERDTLKAIEKDYNSQAKANKLI